MVAVAGAKRFRAGNAIAKIVRRIDAWMIFCANSSRYAAKNRNLRAMTLWRMHKWGQALDLTLAQLDDKSKPDLQPESAVHLANIFGDLAQAEYRAEVLDAIRSRPAAMLRLKQFVEKSPKDRTHPLRYLASYLDDQLKLNAVASN